MTPDEILFLLRTRKANKALGPDSISNDFLKAIGILLATALATLTEAC
jgi:hypothetical protein